MIEEISTVLEDVIEATLANSINTSLPGKITKVVDYKLRKCNVQPTIKINYNGKILEYPVINSVPVQLYGNSKMYVKTSLNVGDPVWIMFAQRSIVNWMYNGNGKLVNDNKKYDYNDAIAFPGVFNFKEIPEINNNNDFEIIFEDSNIIIKENGDVSINNGNLLVKK